MSEMLVSAARERILLTPKTERSRLAVFPSKLTGHVVVAFDQTAVSRNDSVGKIGVFHKGNVKAFDKAMRELGLM